MMQRQQTQLMYNPVKNMHVNGWHFVCEIENLHRFTINEGLKFKSFWMQTFHLFIGNIDNILVV